MLKNLERQMAQIHSLLSQRLLGLLPSDTKQNPKEQVNAVSLRSGKQLEERRQEVGEKDNEVNITLEKNEDLNEQET